MVPITMFNIGMTELVLILVIALIVFGPGKLPEVSKALGKSIQEFRKAASTDEAEHASEAKQIEQKTESAAAVKPQAAAEIKTPEPPADTKQ